MAACTGKGRTLIPPGKGKISKYTMLYLKKLTQTTVKSKLGHGMAKDRACHGPRAEPCSLTSYENDIGRKGGKIHSFRLLPAPTCYRLVADLSFMLWTCYGEVANVHVLRTCYTGKLVCPVLLIEGNAVTTTLGHCCVIAVAAS